MAITKLRVFAIAAIVMFTSCVAYCQPVPGDVFREYMWTMHPNPDAGGALRVGGNFCYFNPTDPSWTPHDAVYLDHDIDLEHATKVELIVEKILCHTWTIGLEIQINGGDWIAIPVPDDIPAPGDPLQQSGYQHHIYPVIPIPIGMLNSGTDNEFVMRVSPTHPWNPPWPQNLINGVHFRVYYDSNSKDHPGAAISSPLSGSTIGQIVELSTNITAAPSPIEQVDYVGYYKDVNFEGDGIYSQWHYHFFHGEIMNHIGSATGTPYPVNWDTSWVPDQVESMSIVARVTDNAGITYITDAVENLTLSQPGLSVELCEPYDVPQMWVTNRSDTVSTKTEKFDVVGNLSRAVAVQLVWSSWSPCYLNGIFINGTKVFQNEGGFDCYAYGAHRITIDDVSSLQSGTNTLKTDQDDPLKHGMEVNWPGIMVLVQYDTGENTCQDIINDGLLMASDLSGPDGTPDCYVNLYDFAAIAGTWLSCNDPQDPECEPLAWINIWHGLEQKVGHLGDAQDDFNLMGELIPADGYDSLTYSLNGAAAVSLTIGEAPTGFRRLAGEGHFNADIPIATLVAGNNKISLVATTKQANQFIREVTVEKLGGSCPLPVAIDWSTVSDPQDVGQYVDGEWLLTDDGLRTKHTGYDRLFLIGERTWQDYEVTVPITIHQVTQETSPDSGANGVGVIFRFTGHIIGGPGNYPDVQPKWGYQPFGAIGWLRWEDGYEAAPRLQFYYGCDNSNNTYKPPIDHGSFSVVDEGKYQIKTRCETMPDSVPEGYGVTLYSFKIWPDGDSEPAGWTWQETQTCEYALREGGIALVAHHVDVTFGDVTVTTIP
ncbi:MAG: hypothetical protein KAJ46_08710 [Sedimentisphaerales bacterium]|nr:hypothetical protein [Sedimentisphaerales bacterium]